ncbi:MAG: hypothetical protein EBR82_75070 [Caulobacteraceae bacterium]|nr:hypothetical protein [Caulobacteraceae bacterium]
MDYDLPDPDDLPEDQINEYYLSKYGGMDPEKGDKDWEITQDEMDQIDKFLNDFDNRNYPPNGPEDFIF